MKKSYEATDIIQSTSHDGRGITSLNGQKVFVTGALEKERVRFEYRPSKKSFIEANTVEILEESLYRATPPCSVYKACGGCSQQHIDPQHQIYLKEQAVLDLILRVGKTEPKEITPPLLGPFWNYRAKARLGCKYVHKKNDVLVGFRETNGRYITDMSTCHTLTTPLADKIMPLRRLISRLSVREKIPQIEAAEAKGEVALIFRHLTDLSDDDRLKLIEFSQSENVRVLLQPKGLDSIYQLAPENTSELLSYNHDAFNIKLEFHPTEFTQINFDINQKMVKQAMEWLDLQKKDAVMDLFCGGGNFSLPAAKLAQKVIGFEGSQQLCDRAYRNAQLNKIQNASFHCTNLYASEHWVCPVQQKIDKVILDPPRQGADKVIQSTIDMAPQAIVAVSCHPATLARDLGIFKEKGYHCAKLCVIDMFPQTHHVETMALLCKD